MADKKESALGAVTDFAQARVLDASGASKNIDKATMASVLAGMLGNDANSSEDLNNLKSTGFHIVYNTNANSPERNEQLSLCHLFVIKIGGENSTQFYINRNTNTFYYRNCTSGNWQTWHKVNTSAV